MKTTSEIGVGLFASANLLAEGGAKIWKILQPAASFCVSLGQIAVAVVTVYYIWKKAKAIRTPKD